MTSALRPSGSTRAWRRMRAIVATTLPAPCSRCGELVDPAEPWDLDHLVALADGGDDDRLGPAHRLCNRRAGAATGRRLRPPMYRATSW